MKKIMQPEGHSNPTPESTTAVNTLRGSISLADLKAMMSNSNLPTCILYPLACFRNSKQASPKPKNGGGER